MCWNIECDLPPTPKGGFKALNMMMLFLSTFPKSPSGDLGVKKNILWIIIIFYLENNQ